MARPSRVLMLDDAAAITRLCRCVAYSLMFSNVVAVEPSAWCDGALLESVVPVVWAV